MKRSKLMTRLHSDTQGLIDELSESCQQQVNVRDAVQLRIDNMKVVMALALRILARQRATKAEVTELGAALDDDDLLSLPGRLANRIVPRTTST